MGRLYPLRMRKMVSRRLCRLLPCFLPLRLSRLPAFPLTFQQRLLRIKLTRQALAVERGQVLLNFRRGRRGTRGRYPFPPPRAIHRRTISLRNDTIVGKWLPSALLALPILPQRAQWPSAQKEQPRLPLPAPAWEPRQWRKRLRAALPFHPAAQEGQEAPAARLRAIEAETGSLPAVWPY